MYPELVHQTIKDSPVVIYRRVIASFSSGYIRIRMFVVFFLMRGATFPRSSYEK